MAALISSVMDTKDKVPFFVAKTEGMGIEILPPDVNISDHEFVVDNGDIRFGLDAVKGVGYAAVEAIKAARESGAVRVDLGLLRARRPARGEQALDRGAHQVRRVRHHRRLAQGHARRARAGAVLGAEEPARRADRPGLDLRPRRWGGPHRRRRRLRAVASADPGEEFEQSELLAIEKEAIGLFISAHPLKEVREALQATVDAPLSELAERRDGDWVTAGGIITQAKKIRTKKGDDMMFATIDDLEGSIECLIFAKALQEYGGALGVDEVVRHPRTRRQGRQGHLDRRADRRAVPALARRRSRPPARPPRSSRRARSR